MTPTTRFIELLKKKELIASVLALFFSYLLFPNYFNGAVFPVPSSGPSWLTLDPSWQIMPNKIIRDHMTWGTDFTFTYGPLSYLATRVGWGVSKYHFILFDLFIWLNFFIVFYTGYIKSHNKTTATLLIAASAILLPYTFGSGNAVLLFAFLVFWIRQSLEREHWFYYLMQIIIVVLVFYIKFNTGLISFVLFCATLLYKFIFSSENKVKLTIVLATPLILIFILAHFLNVALKEYLIGGLNMVSGYNEIMWLNENYVNELTFAMIFIFLGLVILVTRTYREKEARPKNLLILLLFVTFIYILYKQAFTRADIQHILEFYNYVLLFLLCIQDFYYPPATRHSNSVVVAMIFIVIFFARRRDDHIFLVKARLSKADYLFNMKLFTDTAGNFLFPNNNQLPEPVKQRIGKQAIDIYPWNSHLLEENRLNYRSRPVSQSYTAYTPYLEDLNFQFYNSPKAPEFVLYESDAIDGRYATFDEPKLNLVLLQNYNCTDTFQMFGKPMLLLKKNKAKGPVKLTRLKEYTIGLNDAIHPQQGLYYELYLTNSLKGTIRSILYHAPELYLVMRLSDGNIREYRTSKKLLEAGIFSDHLFNSTTDFYNFMQNDSAATSVKIKDYALRVTDPALFKDSIKVIAYKIN